MPCRRSPRPAVEWRHSAPHQRPAGLSSRPGTQHSAAAAAAAHGRECSARRGPGTLAATRRSVTAGGGTADTAGLARCKCGSGGNLRRGSSRQPHVLTDCCNVPTVGHLSAVSLVMIALSRHGSSTQGVHKPGVAVSDALLCTLNTRSTPDPCVPAATHANQQTQHNPANKAAAGTVAATRVSRTTQHKSVPAAGWVGQFA